MTLKFEVSVVPDGIDWIAYVRVAEEEYTLTIPGPATEAEAMEIADQKIRAVIAESFGSKVKSITTENVH